MFLFRGLDHPKEVSSLWTGGQNQRREQCEPGSPDRKNKLKTKDENEKTINPFGTSVLVLSCLSSRHTYPSSYFPHLLVPLGPLYSDVGPYDSRSLPYMVHGLSQLFVVHRRRQVWSTKKRIESFSSSVVRDWRIFILCRNFTPNC